MVDLWETLVEPALLSCGIVILFVFCARSYVEN
jgi:hypothetical protein